MIEQYERDEAAGLAMIAAAETDRLTASKMDEVGGLSGPDLGIILGQIVDAMDIDVDASAEPVVILQAILEKARELAPKAKRATAVKQASDRTAAALAGVQVVTASEPGTGARASIINYSRNAYRDAQSRGDKVLTTEESWINADLRDAGLNPPSLSDDELRRYGISRREP